MQVSAQINNYIESIPPGKIITYQNFRDLQKSKPQALAKALERLVKKQVLIRQAKGTFYRPKETIFGKVSPSDEELISFLTRKDDRITGILTGQSVYLKLQIATQVPNTLTIASITPRKKQTVGKLQVQFVRSYVSSIEKEYIPLIELLEALRFIKKAQDCTPDEIVAAVGKRMEDLTESELKRLVEFAKAYPPMVRTLCGSLCETIPEGLAKPFLIESLRTTLNPYTKYKLPISNTILKNKKAWGIV
ncbi:DUF6088 family protein [Maridesulfovibrio sp.]|uniref:DUF6088 family protein n=1 Tax=unclassified Maridesulfovibrio TaxID=2794999 RepID=UPI003B006588